MPKSANSQFLPPKLNPLLTRLIQSVSNHIAYWGYQLKLDIKADALAKVREIASERVVYLPNHSNLDDGIAIFLLSARLGQIFHYIVAYEAFQGIIGKLLQSVGAYSIRRGMADRQSVIQTLKILQQPACKLVIFPEGGCSYQNDTVMPFRTGAIELSFKALAKLAQQKKTIPDFYLVPVSLKYRYTHNMDAAIARSLRHLETALGIQPHTTDNYFRLKAIAAKVLTNLETEYNLKTTTEENWDLRIKKLKTYLLDWCEQQLDIKPNPQIPMRERVYKIQSYLDSPNEEIPQLLPETKLKIHQATFRLLNFDAIYDGYVAENPTPERFLDTLDRLEREVFQIDRPQPKGDRQACIRFGNPVNLKEYWLSYQENRETTIVKLTQQLQQIVQDNLSL